MARRDRYDRYSYYDSFAPYVPVAERRRQAEREAAGLKQKGQACTPVHISGRTIARSFWGKAWCDNLEAYSDYANRLPRGRTYVRNGSVIDLRIDSGSVKALVSGSSVYRVEVSVQALDPAQWQRIVMACAGQVASLIEVLQGRISKAVMTVVTAPATGLFPLPRQMRFNCSCPDGASMCKHVAATLYGVGARLDDEPELLFKLRHVAAQDLIQQGAALPAGEPLGAAAAADGLAGEDLSALFGIELGEAPVAAPPPPPPPPPAVRAKAPPAAAPVPAPKVKAKAKPVAKKVAVTSGTAISAAELLARGVPRHMIQTWLVDGVLARGSKRGVYRTTRRTEATMKAYLAHRAAA